MVLWSRAPAALPKDPGCYSQNPQDILTTTYNSRSREPGTLFWPLWRGTNLQKAGKTPINDDDDDDAI